MCAWILKALLSFLVSIIFRAKFPYNPTAIVHVITHFDLDDIYLKLLVKTVNYLRNDKVFQCTHKVRAYCKVYAITVFNPTLQNGETAVVYFAKQRTSFHA